MKLNARSARPEGPRRVRHGRRLGDQSRRGRAVLRPGPRVSFVDIDEHASQARIPGHRQPEPGFIRADLKDIAALRCAIARVGQDDGAIRILVNSAADDGQMRSSQNFVVDACRT